MFVYLDVGHGFRIDLSNDSHALWRVWLFTTGLGNVEPVVEETVAGATVGLRLGDPNLPYQGVVKVLVEGRPLPIQRALRAATLQLQ